MPATGYRSVTIREEIYDILRYIHELKKKYQEEKTMTEIVETLIKMYSKPYVRAFIDEAASREQASDTKLGFEAPFHTIVLDEKNIKHYESTSWIRTENYVKKMRNSMLGRNIRNRILDDDEFKVDKIFIISRNSWNEEEVWNWIDEWARLCYIRGKQLSLFVLKEKTADEALGIKDDTSKEKLKYYDMGIYKLSQDLLDSMDTIGYLQIDAQSNPVIYNWIPRFKDGKELESAEKYFAKLKEKAQPIESPDDVEMLQKQRYN